MAAKLTKREEALARRVGKGGTEWVRARRQRPGLTLREFELGKAGDLDELEGTAPEEPIGAAPVPDDETSGSGSAASGK